MKRRNFNIVAIVAVALGARTRVTLFAAGTLNGSDMRLVDFGRKSPPISRQLANASRSKETSCRKAIVVTPVRAKLFSWSLMPSYAW